jgi:catechol 2,3-dioxygenase-like lactoylglutathione lyase family enzyme
MGFASAEPLDFLAVFIYRWSCHTSYGFGLRGAVLRVPIRPAGLCLAVTSPLQVRNVQVQLTSTVLFVADIERARSMYRDVLEQEISAEGATEVVFSSGLSLRKNAYPPRPPREAGERGHIPHHMELHFETDDIDEVAGRVLEADLELLHPVAENPRGQRFLRFFDSDSHLIEVGEQIECVVYREASAGIPAELIAQKTGLPAARVLSILAGDPASA